MNWRHHHLSVFLAAALSGICLIVSQLIWARLFSTAFGADHSGSLWSLATNVAGYALGARVWPSVSNWRRRTLGAIAVLLTVAISAPIAIMVTSFDVPSSPLLLSLFPFTCIVGAVGSSIALAWVIPSSVRHANVAAASLYVAQGLCGWIGALVVSYVAIPRLGLLTSAIVNGIGIVGLLIVQIRQTERLPSSKVNADECRRQGTDYSPLLFIFFLSIAAAATQIVCLRVIQLVTASSTHSLAMVSGGFLFGFAAGSLAYLRRHDQPRRRRGPAASQAWLTLAFLPGVIAIIWLAPSLVSLAAEVRTGTVNIWEVGAANILVTLLLTILPGALFGYGLNFGIGGLSNVNLHQRVAKAISVDAIGCCIGFFLAGTVAIERWGITGPMAIVAAAGVAPLMLTRSAPRLLCGVSLLASLAIFSQPLERRMTEALTGTRNPDGTMTPAYDSNHSLVVHRMQNLPPRLIVGGLEQAAGASADLTNAMVAHLPIALHPRAKDVVVIGLGSGGTASAALAHDIDRVTVLEVSSAVAKVLHLMTTHDQTREHDLVDPRLEIVVRDGVHFFAQRFANRATPQFDVVTTMTFHLWFDQASSLFSASFYRYVARSLKPQGIFQQWLPLDNLDDTQFLRILRAMRQSFEYLSIWRVADHAMVIGSNEPLKIPSPDTQPLTITSANSVGDLVIDHTTLLAMQAISNQGLNELLGSPVGELKDFETTNNPMTEYTADRVRIQRRQSTWLYSHDERSRDTTRLMISQLAIDEAAATRVVDNSARLVDPMIAKAIQGQSSAFPRAARDLRLNSSLTKCAIDAMEPLGKDVHLSVWQAEALAHCVGSQIRSQGLTAQSALIDRYEDYFDWYPAARRQMLHDLEEFSRYVPTRRPHAYYAGQLKMIP